MEIKKPTLNIDFFGDLSLSGLFCDPQNLSQLKSNLSIINASTETPDIRVVNWESPVTEFYDFHKSKKTILATHRTPAEVVSTAFNIDVAILGNNHIGDCRDEGLKSTTSFLDSKGIKHVGASPTEKGANTPLIFQKNNLSVGFLSYVEEATHPRLESDVDIYINILNPTSVVSDIHALKSKVDIVIISLHWGKEFTSYPSNQQREIAKAFIDAGANIIYGHHTHCLQGIENWKNGIIIYSLGNFIFSGLKGKESFGWPKVSQYSGYYTVSIYREKEIKTVFNPLISNISNISIDKNIKRQKMQLTLNNTFNLHPSLYNIRRLLNSLYTWLFTLPFFFYKTKGGIFNTLKSIRKQHFLLVINIFLRK